MQINIHAPFEVNDYLKQVIREKVEKLNTYYGRIHKADIYLRMKVSAVPNGKTVEINLHIPIKNAFAKHTEDTFEKAVAIVTSKLEKQLRKRKEILAKKH